MLLYTSYDQREHRAADALTVYNWIPISPVSPSLPA